MIKKWWARWKRWNRIMKEQGRFLCPHGRVVCPMCEGHNTPENLQAWEDWEKAFYNG